MAITVGELVAFMKLDNEGFTSGEKQIKDGMKRMQSDATSTTSTIESTVSAGFARVAKAIADGVDPDEALRDLDRLTSGFESSMNTMTSDADTGGQKVVTALKSALGETEADAEQAGRDAGKRLIHGLDDGLKDADRVAREHGKDAGEGLGDGTESSGKSRMSGVASGLMGALKAAPWLAAGAAIGALFMAGLSAAMEKQNAVALLSAQVGAFGPRSAELGAVAGQVYADAYGESMGDVTGAIKSVIQNIGGMDDASAESLKGMTERAMDVAQVMGEEVGPVTAAVSQMLRTGLAKNAEEAFDILVRGTQEGVNKSEDLLDTFNEYSTKFRDIGLDGQTAMGLLSQGLQGGARDADTVADALKEFAIRARDGSDTSVAAFEKIGLNGDKMTAVFAKGGPGAAKALDLVIGKIQAIKDPVERNAVGVALFGTKFEDLGASFMSLDPSKAAASLGTLGGAAQTAGATLADTASNKIESFKRGLQQGVVDFIGGNVLPALEGLWAGFQGSGLEETLSGIGEKVSSTFGGIVEDVKAWAADNEETITAVKDKFEEIFTKIGEVVGVALDLIKTIWDEWGDEIMTTVTIVLDQVGAIIGGALDVIKGIIKTVTGLIKGDWGMVWDGIKDILYGALSGIRNFLESTMKTLFKQWGLDWDSIKKTAGNKIDEVVKFVQKLPERIMTFFKDAKNWLLEAGKNVILGLINGIKAMAGKAVDAAKGVINDAISGAKKLLGIQSPSKVFHEIGQFIVQGLAEGIDGNAGQAASAVDRLVEMVTKGFGKKPSADPLVEFVQTNTKKLSELADQREVILKRIADAKEYAKQIEESAKEFAKITSIQDPQGVSDLTGGLKSKLQQMKDFAKNVQELARRGLNKTVLKQILDAGVEGGGSLAEMLVGADNSEIKALNKAQKQIDSMSKKLGKIGADALFDTGKKAGEGYLKGLEGSLKKLDATMKKIVDALVRAIKKELRIKSPSQVMADIGQQTMDGLNLGITQGTSGVLTNLKNIGQQMGDAVATSARDAVGRAYAVPKGQEQMKNLLGGAKFGLDVQGIAPDLMPTGKQAGSVPPGGPSAPDGSGVVAPGSAGGPGFSITNQFHNATVDAAEVTRLNWLQATAHGYVETPL